MATFAPPRPATVLLLGLAALAGMVLGACGEPVRSPAKKARLTLFAAASLSDVASDLGEAYRAQRGGPGLEITYNFAGSNTLAQQIRAAPVADVFLSADEAWVRFLSVAGKVVEGSQKPFLSNRLVLVVHRDSSLSVTKLGDLAHLPYRHLALADPEAVPAGRYARAALSGIASEGGTLWESVSARVVPTLDVRAALGLVEADREILAIVYRTDAQASPKVRELLELPSSPRHPITYWAAAIEGAPNPEEARRFLAFLDSAEVLAIGERHGFLPPPERAAAEPASR